MKFSWEFSIGILIGIWVPFIQPYASNIPNLGANSDIFKYISSFVFGSVIDLGAKHATAALYTSITIFDAVLWWSLNVFAVIVIDTVSFKKSRVSAKFFFSGWCSLIWSAFRVIKGLNCSQSSINSSRDTQTFFFHWSNAESGDYISLHHLSF